MDGTRLRRKESHNRGAPGGEAGPGDVRAGFSPTSETVTEPGDSQFEVAFILRRVFGGGGPCGVLQLRPAG